MLLRKHCISVGVIVAVCTLSYCLLLPQNFLYVGNLFFGGSERFYNVDRAQYFYVYAAYPLVGKAEPYAHYQLSRTYFIQGDLGIALTEAKKELELYPTHYRTYYILGLTYGYMNREMEAIQAFSEFIKHNPYSWAARNDKAWLQFRIGDISGALETMEPIAWINNNPWVQNTYGTILLNAGRTEEARIAFEYALAAVEGMTATSWGEAYPGNDPRIYHVGLDAMKVSIVSNLKLIEISVDIE